MEVQRAIRSSFQLLPKVISLAEVTELNVSVWSGNETKALREAMRLSVRAFAEHIGVTPRMVSTWEARGDAVKPRPVNQAALDTCVEQLGTEAVKRFQALLLSRPGNHLGENSFRTNTEVEMELNVAPLLSWVVEHSKILPTEAYQEVCKRVSELRSLPQTEQFSIQHNRKQISQERLTEGMVDFYGNISNEGSFFRAKIGGASIISTIFVRSALELSLEVDLQGDNETAHYIPSSNESISPLDDFEVNLALQRIAEFEFSKTVVTNNVLYELRGLNINTPYRLNASYGSTDFLRYAVGGNLLEDELVRQLLGSGKSKATNAQILPIRAKLLPDIESLLKLSNRSCVGGVQVLCAIARQDDYLVLVQRRSSRVLNSNERLALVPKAFHQPMVEPFLECSLFQTIVRELEEELLGRDDLSGTENFRLAEPLHRNHMTQPMKWLMDRARTKIFRTLCVGFGLDTITGNYEFACLCVIDDPAWWDIFGGHVTANWESSGLFRFSTKDSDGLTLLVMDKRWSNEGLFAFLVGLRRLAAVGDARRLSIPHIELEI